MKILAVRCMPSLRCFLVGIYTQYVPHLLFTLRTILLRIRQLSHPSPTQAPSIPFFFRAKNDAHRVWVELAAPGASAFTLTRCATFLDRKCTRLNSSHLVISYAVFCLKKKKKTKICIIIIRLNYL